MNKRGPLLLIDADVLRYQLAFSNTANIDWNGDGNKVEAIQPERAKAKLEDYIDEIVEKFGARDYLLALSCKKHNFRKDIDPTYKLNRASKDKPALWYVLDEFVYDEFGDKIVEIENLEGDDVLGLLASHPNPKRAPGSRIVVSIDKDMQTIPGIRLYNPNRPDVGVRPISAHDADLFWMKQVLTGDQVDNYPASPASATRARTSCSCPSTRRTAMRPSRSTSARCGTPSSPPTPPASPAAAPSRCRSTMRSAKHASRESCATATTTPRPRK